MLSHKYTAKGLRVFQTGPLDPSSQQYQDAFTFYETDLIAHHCAVVWTGDTEVTVTKKVWTGFNRRLGKFDHGEKLMSLYAAWLYRDDEPSSPTERSEPWVA